MSRLATPEGSQSVDSHVDLLDSYCQMKKCGRPLLAGVSGDKKTGVVLSKLGWSQAQEKAVLAVKKGELVGRPNT